MMCLNVFSVRPQPEDIKVTIREAETREKDEREDQNGCLLFFVLID